LTPQEKIIEKFPFWKKFIFVLFAESESRNHFKSIKNVTLLKVNQLKMPMN
jgi:hypothetical protein